MPDMQVTHVSAAIIAVAVVILAIAVSVRRRTAKISLGVQEDETLHRLVRAHGNLVEYAPLALILLGLLELANGPQRMALSIAGLLLSGRLLHAIGMLAGLTPLRALGMVLTHASLITGAIGVILYCRPA
jgi:uncharacterized membrane protein YecN with MAPEG domain